MTRTIAIAVCVAIFFQAAPERSFEVASVKLNKVAGRMSSNVTLGPGARFVPTGGLFSAHNVSLFLYLIWAYDVSGYDLPKVQAQLPSWANSEQYDIEARAEGNPDKAEMQSMMRSLLADRFKLAVHRETKDGPVLALTLAKPGQTGAHLQPHVGTSCIAADKAVGAGEVCGAGISGMPAGMPGRLRIGARDIMFDEIVRVLPATAAMGTGVDRPVLDRTGLSGAFDFDIEFSPEAMRGGGPPNFTPDPTAPTFLQALQDQLGLKLERTTGPIQALIIDHIERLVP